MIYTSGNVISIWDFAALFVVNCTNKYKKGWGE